MNQSVLVLADFTPRNLVNTQPIDDQYFDFEKLFKEARESLDSTHYFIRLENPKALLNRLKKQVNVIKAAGGVVRNGKGEFLFIFRLNKWDLPKGKVDENESSKMAAIREVEEECGIRINYLGPKISTTYHAYTLKGELVIKKTKWYDMGVNNVPKLQPQLEEDITQAIWLPKDQFSKIRENTYPLINDLLDVI